MYNILWLFIDGVRRYHTTDDRSKLNFMDEFAAESIEMKNVVTSAPSTFMSLSAMISGMPAYYINRNFGDFIFDKNFIPSLTNILSDYGYNIYSFIMHQSTRENMLNIFPMIERKYWPNGLSHGDWWSNSDINRAVDKTLIIGVKKPAFFFVDYNCREDSEISNKVEWAFNRFREAGYTADNTITILCSDHGYPDPSKETGRPEYYIKNKIGHDFVLTDDNIMIPMYIQYPGCEKKLSIDTTVSSIDLFPTLLELSGIDYKSGLNIVGKSWVPLFNKDENYEEFMNSRYHRCDNRFTFQNDKGTVIRNDKYKYVKFHGSKISKPIDEEFYDIINDPLEEKNLIYVPDPAVKEVLKTFKDEFIQNENIAFNYQIEFLFQKIVNNKIKSLNKANNVLITDSSNVIFIKMLIQILKRVNSNINIYILTVENQGLFDEIIEGIKIISADNITSYKTAYSSKELLQKLENEKIELILVPYSTTEGRDNKYLRKFVKKVKNAKKIFIDYNLGHYNKTIFNYYIKKFKPMFHFAKHEPMYVSNFVVSNFLKYIKQKI